MPNHYTTTVDPRDLTSRLNDLKEVSPSTNDSPTTHSDNSTTTTMSGRPRRNRASSFSSTDLTTSFSHLPRFTKSATTSTTSSSGSDNSRFAITHAVPKTKTQRESAHVGVGEFSKPRVNRRSRRDTGASSTSATSTTRSEGGQDFRYYGRHSNQWLFNDFSVTESLRKGWGKVFGKEEKGDWFENRN